MISLSTSLRLIAWSILVAITAWVGWKEGSGTSEISRTPKVTIVPDVPYRDWNGRGPRLDLYVPPSGEQPPESGFPAVLLVHGGSWIGGSKSSYRRDPWRNATRLARHGIVVIAVDYRLGRPGLPSLLDAWQDLRAAVRWARNNASTYRIDPDRIAVLGQSAGAHLAMMVGTEGDDGTSADVQAVIGFYGPTDLEALANARRSRRDPIFTLLGQPPFETRGDLEREASPIRRVGRSTPPMFLFHGSDDLWVPADQSREMARALEAAGVFHRLVIVDGARHGFETVVEFPHRRDLVPEILAFLDNVWNASPAKSPRDPAPNRARINDQQRAKPPRGPLTINPAATVAP